MKQFIDKSALVAEIKERIDRDNEKAASYPDNSETDYLYRVKEAVYKDLLSFLDTLEVKEVDLEKDVRQIVSLYYEGIKYYEDVIKKEREENGGSDLAIKIMDGVVDARELSIQYVIDKLKAQKGE